MTRWGRCASPSSAVPEGGAKWLACSIGMDVACGSSEYWLMAAICPGSAIRINTASTQGLSETMRCGLAAAATDCGNTQRIAKARYLKNRIRTPLNNNMGPLRDWLG